MDSFDFILIAISELRSSKDSSLGFVAGCSRRLYFTMTLSTLWCCLLRQVYFTANIVSPSLNFADSWKQCSIGSSQFLEKNKFIINEAKFGPYILERSCLGNHLQVYETCLSLRPIEWRMHVQKCLLTL